MTPDDLDARLLHLEQVQAEILSRLAFVMTHIRLKVTQMSSTLDANGNATPMATKEGCLLDFYTDALKDARTHADPPQH